MKRADRFSLCHGTRRQTRDREGLVMKCALLQLNATVGDIAANAGAIVSAARKAAGQGAELCVTSELALTGYPPRDLLMYPAFVAEAEAAAQRIAEELADLDAALVLGAPARNPAEAGKPLTNTALFLYRGEVLRRYNKRLLPTYDVFDESRYFEPGTEPCVVHYKGVGIALTICEDIWNDSAFRSSSAYPVDPLGECPPFDMLVNLSASPFTSGKQALRQDMLTALARRYRAHILYANTVGGNDDLIFDGRSMSVSSDGSIGARALAFAEDCLVVDTDVPSAPPEPVDMVPDSEIWQALVLGVRDYCRKVGITRAGLGLSGGIDSALVAAIACDALGPENVHGYLLPSPYSSTHSLEDARSLAANLGMPVAEIPIKPGMEAFDGMLAECFAGKKPDVTEENIQARLRGNLLMALSNKFGFLLLTTGNKSEISVGYCTIYGDMCGGLAVIGDVYKTEVFRLCRWLNGTRGVVIPENTLTKPPSAELRPDQTDQDSLPPYDELDAMLAAMLEERKTCSELAAEGFDAEIARKVARLVAGAEFKRRQAAPVLKITRQAFGVGWWMPIACRQALIL